MSPRLEGIVPAAAMEFDPGDVWAFLRAPCARANEATTPDVLEATTVVDEHVSLFTESDSSSDDDDEAALSHAVGVKATAGAGLVWADRAVGTRGRAVSCGGTEEASGLRRTASLHSARGVGTPQPRRSWANLLRTPQRS